MSRSSVAGGGGATVALVSARSARDLDEDMPALERALAARGLTHAVVDWDDPQVDWSAFASAVLRSTWDYSERLDEFLGWVDRAARQTRLLNPPALLRWNTHKGYLLELAARGVPVVPTRLLHPGQEPPGLDAGEWVVKPAVGAGSRGARRFRDAPQAARAHARELLDQGRDVLIQPYLRRVDDAGETALIHFGGRFSHAIRKGPLLRAGAEATRALFAPEQIRPRDPGADELALAARVLASLPFAEPPLYARVDLLRLDSGEPVLLELELTEPSLFFDTAPGSAERFVAALAASLA